MVNFATMENIITKVIKETIGTEITSIAKKKKNYFARCRIRLAVEEVCYSTNYLFIKRPDRTACTNCRGTSLLPATHKPVDGHSPQGYLHTQTDDITDIITAVFNVVRNKLLIRCWVHDGMVLQTHKDLNKANS
jgi:hypothetical protein